MSGIYQAASDIKTAAAVAVGTTGTGVGTILDLIPDSVGKLATLVGVVLSLVLIYSHLRGAQSKAKADAIAYEMALLKLALLQEEEAERALASAMRDRRESDEANA